MNQDPGFFISYAHKDIEYVDRLVSRLRGFDLPLWFDRDLRVGAGFSQEIRQRIMRAFAVIVVMSPAAESSEWVEREILEGQFRDRDFVPILLSGDRFFLLASSHYFDARDGSLPDENLVRQLRDIRDARGPGTRGRPSLVLSAPVQRPARTSHTPIDASLRKLRTLLDEGRIEHADIFTTQLLLEAVGRLDSGWMRRADGASLSFGLLADVDEAWSRFSRETQGFRAQVSRYRRPLDGVPAGSHRDFSKLVLSLGWESAQLETKPSYGEFVTVSGHPDGFFPTLRNPQSERCRDWYDQWLETAMAVHLQLRRWRGGR